MSARKLEIRSNLESVYPDIFTPEAIAALEALAYLDADRKAVMKGRIERRAARARNKQRITFLDPKATIARTNITVQDARDGNFVGSEIPKDLQRQWIQGTGPAAKPNAPMLFDIGPETESPNGTGLTNRQREALKSLANQLLELREMLRNKPEA